jgi:hypothetical protein
MDIGAELVVEVVKLPDGSGRETTLWSDQDHARDNNTPAELFAITDEPNCHAFAHNTSCASASAPAARRRAGARLWYSFYTLMRFEFDAAKSAANKAKHGIDFVEAQALWLDVDRLELPARPMNEPRALIIDR